MVGYVIVSWRVTHFKGHQGWYLRNVPFVPTRQSYNDMRRDAVEQWRVSCAQSWKGTGKMEKHHSTLSISCIQSHFDREGRKLKIQNHWIFLSTHTHHGTILWKKTASRLSDKILKMAPLLIACYVAGWRFLWPWSGHFLFPEVSTSKFTFWYLEFGSEVGRTWVTTRSCNAFATYVWSKVMREFVSSLSNKYYNQARLSG